MLNKNFLFRKFLVCEWCLVVNTNIPIKREFIEQCQYVFGTSKLNCFKWSLRAMRKFKHKQYFVLSISILNSSLCNNFMLWKINEIIRSKLLIWFGRFNSFWRSEILQWRARKVSNLCYLCPVTPKNLTTIRNENCKFKYFHKVISSCLQIHQLNRK